MEKTTVLKLLFKICLALITSLLVWELIISNTIIKVPGTQIHEVLGKIYNEGFYLQGQEGFCKTNINSLGMRGSEIDIENNATKILFLGDSYTQAFQVNDKNTYVSLFEKYFSKELNNNINCINAGKAGASPADYIYLADFYNKKIKPDYVVIQINISDIKTDLLNKKSFIYLDKTENNYQLIKNNKFKSENPLKDIIPFSDKLVKLSVIRLGGEQTQKIFEIKASNEYTEKTIETNYEPIIDWTLKSIKNKYDNSIILFLPNTCINGSCSKADKTEKLIEKYSKKYKLSFINMREPFLEFAKNNNEEIRGFNNSIPAQGHLNKYGHKLVAQELLKYFENKEIIK